MLRKLAAVLAIFLILGGCHSEKDSEKVSITIGNWAGPDTESDQTVMQKYKEDFEKENPEIEIIPQPYNYEVNIFIAKAESGQLPNLVHTYYTETEKIIRAGYVRDITDTVKKYGYDNSIRSDLMRLCLKNGRIYGLPYTFYKLGLWCNVSIFKEAGLVDENGIPKFPKSWEELAETAVIIKEKTGKTAFFLPTKENLGGWHYYSIASSYGAEFEKIDEDGNIHADFTNHGAVKAMQFIKDLKWKYGVLSENQLLGWAEYISEFGSGNAAMAIGTTDSMQILAEAGMDKDDFSICRMPEGDAGQFSQMGGNVIMFSKNTTDAQLDACMKWLQFSGFTPDATERKKQVLEESFAQDDKIGTVIMAKRLEVWKDEALSSEVDDIIKAHTNVNYELQRDFFENELENIKPELSYNAQEFYAVIDKVIQKIISDPNADPYTELKLAEENFTELYLNGMNG